MTDPEPSGFQRPRLKPPEKNPIRSIFKKRLDPHMQEIVGGAFVAFGLKAAGAALSFGFNVVLSRTLGAEGAGAYFLALTVSTAASVLGRMGLDTSLVRFVASGAAKGDWGAVQGVYRRGVTNCAMASSAVSLAMFLGAGWLAERVFAEPGLAPLIQVMAFSVLPFAMLNLHAEMLKGLKRISYSVFIQGVGVAGASMALIYPMARAWGAKGAVLSYLIATALTASAAVLLWRSSTPMLRGVAGRFESRVLLNSSMPLFWVALLGLFMQWFSMFILGVWGTKTEVGVFGAAQRMAMLISLILIAINSIAAPKFAELHSRGDFKALASTAWRSARLATAAALPLMLLFVLAPGKVMSLFGPDFRAGGLELAILAAGQFVNVVIGPVGFLLMMSGNEQRTRRDVFIGSAATVILTLALVPSWGSTGAAIATSAGLVVMNLFLVSSVSSLLGIRMLGAGARTDA